jgi:2-hydroxycyclohexanecarboxyl-CoA dehydrogenase
MFQDLRVLVTGGTSGIGLATAIAFAEAGVRRIALVGRNAERGREATQQVAATGAAVKFVPADANSCDQARRAGGAAIAHLGGIECTDQFDSWIGQTRAVS